MVLNFNSPQLFKYLLKNEQYIIIIKEMFKDMQDQIMLVYKKLIYRLDQLFYGLIKMFIYFFNHK